MRSTPSRPTPRSRSLIVAFAVPNELGETSQRLAGVAFSLALAACVPFRRRAPVAVFVAVSVLCLVQFAVLERIVAGDVVALIAIYTLVAYSLAAARSGRCAASSAPCSPRSAGRTRHRTSRSRPGGGDDRDLGPAGGDARGLAALAPRWSSARCSERNRLLAVERDQQAALERARIARELHDVVAHSLSVIVVQADGRRPARSSARTQAVAALGTIGETAREALGQMRRLLGVLRERRRRGSSRPSRAPPSWTRSSSRSPAPAYRRGCRARAGRGDVGGEVDLTLYRLAQEALTNVLKHAGPVSRVDVVLRYRDDAVELLVRDDGRGAQRRRRRARARPDRHARARRPARRHARGRPERGSGFEVRRVVAA